MCIKIHTKFQKCYIYVPVVAHYQNHFILIFRGSKSNIGKINVLNIRDKCFVEFTLTYTYYYV